MELRLRAADERADKVSRQVRDFSEELDLLRQKTETAQREAADATRRANESAAAERQAVLKAERAREETESVRGEALRAQAELDRVRQAREQELNRMQEALNRVAPTRRTFSGMVIELADESFRFDFDQATLRPANRELLSRIAGILLASKGYSLHIYGHTDDIGTEKYNQDLSERRAKSVQDYLVKAGVPAEVISTKGFGNSSPLTNEKTREARQRNRRVEIGVVDTIIQYGREVKRPSP
jgi:outer membrane protein OmpA-like peptidoglycan-associated protein